MVSGSGGDGAIGRMGRENGVRVLTAVIGAARPWVAGRITGHSGADRIKVDMALTVQCMAFAVDQAGLATALPQCSGAPVAGIELADVAASRFLHGAGDRPDFRRRGQQVDLVVHQHAGVQSAASVEQRLARHGQVASPIGIIWKAGKAVVAALDNVLRNSGKVESGLSGHCLRIGVSVFPR